MGHFKRECPKLGSPTGEKRVTFLGNKEASYCFPPPPTPHLRTRTPDSPLQLLLVPPDRPPIPYLPLETYPAEFSSEESEGEEDNREVKDDPLDSSSPEGRVKGESENREYESSCEESVGDSSSVTQFPILTSTPFSSSSMDSPVSLLSLLFFSPTDSSHEDSYSRFSFSNVIIYTK
jgi:hypothetical protein